MVNADPVSGANRARSRTPPSGHPLFSWMGPVGFPTWHDTQIIPYFPSHISHITCVTTSSNITARSCVTTRSHVTSVTTRSYITTRSHISYITTRSNVMPVVLCRACNTVHDSMMVKCPAPAVPKTPVRAPQVFNDDFSLPVPEEFRVKPDQPRKPEPPAKQKPDDSRVYAQPGSPVRPSGAPVVAKREFRALHCSDPECGYRRVHEENRVRNALRQRKHRKTP